MVTSCNSALEPEQDIVAENAKASHRTFIGDSTVLQNPYSVKVMQTALDNIKNTDVLNSSLIENFTVKASHLYVKFNPRNKADEDL